MPFPKLMGEIYNERRGANPPANRTARFNKNSETIFGYRAVPAGAVVDAIQYQIVVQSSKAYLSDQQHTAQLDCWWLPEYGAGRTATVTTYTALKNLYDERVAKVEVQDFVGNAGNRNNIWTPTESDIQLGDDDNNLRYQPGRVSLEHLTDAHEAANLFSRRLWMGYMHGNAYRVGGVRGSGEDAKSYVRTQLVLKGWIRKAVATQRPGYIVWVLNNPNTIDDQYTGSGANGSQAENDELAKAMPRQGEWAALNFLAPDYDRLEGHGTIYPSNSDDYLRWVKQWATDGHGDDNDKQLLAMDLDVNWHMTDLWNRAADRMIVPAATTTNPIGNSPNDG